METFVEWCNYIRACRKKGIKKSYRNELNFEEKILLIYRKNFFRLNLNFFTGLFTLKQLTFI